MNTSIAITTWATDNRWDVLYAVRRPLAPECGTVSKPSRRPGREAIKEQRKARKKAQRELRQRQKEQGLSAPEKPSQSNRTCPYQTQEEERAARVDAVGQQVKVYRAMLPVLLKRLSKVSDPRNPRKLRHKLTVLWIYGILCFAFQMSSRRKANQEMTRPVFEANLRQLFPDLEELPHQDTLARLLICEESWEEIAPGGTEVVKKTSRHAWLSDQPLHRNNVHSRCNLGARHRWGIETGFLVEKHHGYQYQPCFSYDWVTMRGYHYLMRLGHALNILAHYSHALANHVRDLGARGLIEFVRSTIEDRLAAGQPASLQAKNLRWVGIGETRVVTVLVNRSHAEGCCNPSSAKNKPPPVRASALDTT